MGHPVFVWFDLSWYFIKLTTLLPTCPPQVSPWYEYMGSEYKGYGGGGSVTGYERDNGVSDRGSEVEGFGTPAGLNTNVSSVACIRSGYLFTKPP